MLGDSSIVLARRVECQREPAIQVENGAMSCGRALHFVLRRAVMINTHGLESGRRDDEAGSKSGVFSHRISGTRWPSQYECRSQHSRRPSKDGKPLLDQDVTRAGERYEWFQSTSSSEGKRVASWSIQRRCTPSGETATAEFRTANLKWTIALQTHPKRILYNTIRSCMAKSTRQL